jgi:hypothetical protein
MTLIMLVMITGNAGLTKRAEYGKLLQLMGRLLQAVMVGI